MKKDKLIKLERRLEAQTTYVEAPIFLFRTGEGVLLSDYCLKRLGINPEVFKPSLHSPEERILTSGEYIDLKEEYAYLTKPKKTFIILDYETTNN